MAAHKGPAVAMSSVLEGALGRLDAVLLAAGVPAVWYGAIHPPCPLPPPLTRNCRRRAPVARRQVCVRICGLGGGFRGALLQRQLLNLRPNDPAAFTAAH